VKYGALFGWGIVIYAVAALVWSLLFVHGFGETLVIQAAQVLAIVAAATVAGRALHLHSWPDILPYSIFWALTAAVLDLLYSRPLHRFDMYTDWKIWLTYGLIVVVPLLALSTRRHAHRV
jgi:hypothetical protein